MAIETWPVTKLVSHIRKLPPHSQLAREELGDMADWNYLAENVARLVDVMTAWLNYEYASWTADPAETEYERNRRKRQGIKPPPFPMIPPVASRPPSARDLLADEYARLAAEYQMPTGEARERMISSDELDVLLGL